VRKWQRWVTASSAALRAVVGFRAVVPPGGTAASTPWVDNAAQGRVRTVTNREITFPAGTRRIANERITRWNWHWLGRG
jgi:hypothetical protein